MEEALQQAEERGEGLARLAGTVESIREAVELEAENARALKEKYEQKKSWKPKWKSKKKSKDTFDHTTNERDRHETAKETKPFTHKSQPQKLVHLNVNQNPSGECLDGNPQKREQRTPGSSYEDISAEISAKHKKRLSMRRKKAKGTEYSATEPKNGIEDKPIEIDNQPRHEPKPADRLTDMTESHDLSDDDLDSHQVVRTLTTTGTVETQTHFGVETNTEKEHTSPRKKKRIKLNCFKGKRTDDDEQHS